MAYINAAEVKAIRIALKAEFGKKFKFSVRKSSWSGSVKVSIMKGDVDFSGVLEGRDYLNVNHYYTENYSPHAELFEKIVEIIKTAPSKAGVGDEWFDESDIMTDYFHTAYYFDVGIGTWNTPYVRNA